MKFTRIFTGTDEKSHFEDLEIPLKKIEFGKITAPISANSILLAEIDDINEINWHNPPCRQYLIMLEGAMQIETGYGVQRIFNPGDILLAEDITGQGHITRAASSGKRKYLVIPIE